MVILFNLGLGPVTATNSAIKVDFFLSTDVIGAGNTYLFSWFEGDLPLSANIA